MAEQIAVADLGSNSFRLVVFTAADGWWKRTDEIYLPVRIGEGLEASGELGAEPIERALQAAIEPTGREAASEAVEHRLEHMIMRKQEQVDYLLRAQRRPD